MSFLGSGLIVLLALAAIAGVVMGAVALSRQATAGGTSGGQGGFSAKGPTPASVVISGFSAASDPTFGPGSSDNAGVIYAQGTNNTAVNSGNVMDIIVKFSTPFPSAPLMMLGGTIDLMKFQAGSGFTWDREGFVIHQELGQGVAIPNNGSEQFWNYMVITA